MSDYFKNYFRAIYEVTNDNVFLAVIASAARIFLKNHNQHSRIKNSVGNTMNNSETWHYTTDVLIVGSGAGALTAAVRAADNGLNVLVVEKTELWGGTSAMSGGVVWLPNSPLISAAGGEDSIAEAREYMRRVIDNPEQHARIDAYINSTGKLVQFLNDSAGINLTPNPHYVDMYPDVVGAKWQYRAHEFDPIDGALLGDDIHTLRRQHPQTTLFGFIGWTANDATILQTRAPGWLKTAFGLVAGYFLDFPWRLKSFRDRRLVLGGSLVAGLRMAAKIRGITMWLSSPVTKLISDDIGVVGVVVQRDGHEVRVRARRGVIIASGGFERNTELRNTYLPRPTDARWTAGSPGNTGDLLMEGLRLGADTRFLEEAWWGPTTLVPGEPQARILIIEKNLPGSMLVTRSGDRFVNESSSYTKVVKGILKANNNGGECVPAYFIFDANYRKRYPCGPVYPSSVMPDWMLTRRLRKWLYKANSLEDLAEKLGIPPRRLVETAGNMNLFATSGTDKMFNRGGSLYDRIYGDQTNKPNPCLGAISTPPFYAIKVYPGDLGTKGGLHTDEFARVLNVSGHPIRGLYATGNCAASVMGSAYPASGATLGPAMIFGLIAADHIGLHSEF